MIDITNDCSLSDFQHNFIEHLQRLKETGEAEVLTVNGRAELVVQSAAAAYQKLLERADLVGTVAVLRGRIAAAADAGEKGIPADQALAKMKERLGVGELR